MKIMKNGLLGFFVAILMVAMPLQGIALEDDQQLNFKESEDVEAKLKELEEITAQIDNYVASLSPEDQAEFYRAVAEIEGIYDYQQTDDKEDNNE